MSEWKHYNISFYKRNGCANINKDRGSMVCTWCNSSYDAQLVQALKDLTPKSYVLQDYVDFIEGFEHVSLDTLADYVHANIMSWDYLCNDLCFLSAAMPDLLFEVEIENCDHTLADWRVIARDGEYWTVDIVKFFPPYDNMADGGVDNV